LHLAKFVNWQISGPRLPGTTVEYGMKFRPLSLEVILLISLPGVSAAELPDFESDVQADRWLRKSSTCYRRMAESVDRNGGYAIIHGRDAPAGLAYFKDGRGYIELHDSLKGAHRVSVLIFELTNLHQEDRHQEVAHRVRRGELNNPAEFALLRESIEYDGLRLHHGVLQELEAVVGTVPAEMITWVSSTAKSFAEYQLPFAYDYLKAQAAGGHTAHYFKLFETHRAEYSEATRGAQPPKSHD
jgi:hypothetical protein